MAKRFIVIGLGIFGEGIARELYEQGNEVVAVDVDEEKVNRIAESVSRAAVGDARNEDVLDRAGAGDADVAIVTTGSDIGASILTVMALRDLGVPRIYAKVISFDHARILRKMGVTETVFPEHESSINLAQKITHADSLLNYVRLSGDFSVQEMAVPNRWLGSTLRELSLRSDYGVAVIAVRDALAGRMNPVPDPDAQLKDSDTLLIAGAEKDLDRVAEID